MALCARSSVYPDRDFNQKKLHARDKRVPNCTCGTRVKCMRDCTCNVIAARSPDVYTPLKLVNYERTCVPTLSYAAFYLFNEYYLLSLT